MRACVNQFRNAHGCSQLLRSVSSAINHQTKQWCCIQVLTDQISKYNSLEDVEEFKNIYSKFQKVQTPENDLRNGLAPTWKDEDYTFNHTMNISSTCKVSSNLSLLKINFCPKEFSKDRNYLRQTLLRPTGHVHHQIKLLSDLQLPRSWKTFKKLPAYLETVVEDLIRAGHLGSDVPRQLFKSAGLRDEKILKRHKLTARRKLKQVVADAHESYLRSVFVEPVKPPRGILAKSSYSLTKLNHSILKKVYTKQPSAELIHMLCRASPDSLKKIIRLKYINRMHMVELIHKYPSILLEEPTALKIKESLLKLLGIKPVEIGRSPSVYGLSLTQLIKNTEYLMSNTSLADVRSMPNKISHLRDFSELEKLLSTHGFVPGKHLLADFIGMSVVENQLSSPVRCTLTDDGPNDASWLMMKDIRKTHGQCRISEPYDEKSLKRNANFLRKSGFTNEDIESAIHLIFFPNKLLKDSLIKFRKSNDDSPAYKDNEHLLQLVLYDMAHRYSWHNFIETAD